MDADIGGLKRDVVSAIEAARDRIISLGDDIFANAELGWFEHRTAGAVAEALRELGLEPRERIARTGVKAVARGASDGPGVCLMGELDGLPLPDHPRANPTNGAAHACGHNAQLASLYGSAVGIMQSGVLRQLHGRIIFFAVPAEEYVQLERRRELQQDGEIEFLGGKPELLRRGEFDDVDLGLMVHATTSPEHRLLSLALTSNGLVGKQVRFIGRAAHAGSAPHQGINALNAASLALAAIAAQRGTHCDNDHVRIHPIITHGGDVVNIVPAEVRLETYVRGMSIEAILDASAGVDRALKAGAMAVGAGLELRTSPGYLPLHQNRDLAALFRANAISLVGERGWVDAEPFKASTDAGDLSQVMPFLHPSAGGCRGLLHGADFGISDPDTAYVLPAKAMALTVVDLLAEGAQEARRLLAAFRPQLTRQRYLELTRSLAREERIEPGSWR